MRVNSIWFGGSETFWDKVLCMKTWYSSKALWISLIFLVWFLDPKCFNAPRSYTTEICLAIVKNLASNSVSSASYAVLRSFSVPKPSYYLHGSFFNTVFYACLSPTLLMKSSTILFVHVSHCCSPVLSIFIAYFIFFKFSKKTKFCLYGFPHACYLECIKNSSRLGVI